MAILSLLNLGFVYAANEINLNPPGEFSNLTKVDIAKIIPGVIQILLIVATVIAFIFLIIGGIKWITAGSNKEAASEARGTLTAAIIGLALVFLAWAVLKIIETVFGITITTQPFNIPTIY